MLRAVLASLCAGLLLSPAASAQSTFINELHYDNASTDSNEAVEIAAPAGTSLTGWSIVLYNGNGGASYATLPLSGTIPNTCAGYGSVSVAAPGIQNGSPDGIALVNSVGATVQFISYEGAFTATTGPATGLLSVDIGVVEDGTGATTTSLQLVGLGSTYPDFTWTQATASMGACNAGQTFTGGVDATPGVFESTPADGAAGVSPFADLSVTFTEDVIAAPGWYALMCAVSGSVSASQSGSPRTYVLNPSVNLAPGETCTLEITASAITDLDGPINAMAANATIDFTIAPDIAPTVIQTVPAAGANSVPIDSNVAVTFSEPVTVAPGAFDLDCNDSGVRAGTLSGGPTVFTFDPAADFAFLETCDLTLIAVGVSDMDGTPTPLAVDFTLSFGTEQSIADYYAAADDSSAAALRLSLHAIIDDHFRFPYSSSSTDTWDILDLADEDPANPGRVLDVYKNESYPKAGAGNANYNREHRWAKSFGFPDDSSNSWAYTDTHHLIVSNSGYNSARNNRYFDNCPDSCTEYPTTLTNAIGGGSGTYPGNSNWGKGERWEVWDYRKGDVARSMFYMDVRYEGGTNGAGAPEPNLTLTEDPGLIQTTGVNTAGTAYLGLLCVLVEWHVQDPPDELERLRNGIIQSYQQNRNPFVDHPEWVEVLFGDVCEVNAPPVLGNGSFGVQENTPAGTLITTLAATDPDAGQALSYQMVSGNTGAAFTLHATSGQLTVANAAALNFEATPAFTLTVRVTDNGDPSLTDDATITVTLSNQEEGPAQASDDVLGVQEDSGVTQITSALLANDVNDPDGEAPAIIGVTSAAHGVAGFVGGNVNYAPDENFCGQDDFTYQIVGGDTASVTVTVACINDTPVANDATFALPENSGQSTVVGVVTASDIDAGTSLVYAITGGNDSGAFAISASGQVSVAIAAPLNFEVTPQFVLTVTVSDQAAPTPATDTATITIALSNVEEGGAIANDDTVGTSEDAATTSVAVLVNDVADPDGGALQITGAGSAAHGTASFDANSVSYTPAPNYCGPDSVTYTVSGGDSAILSIDVQCTNDAPAAVGTLGAQSAEEGIAIAPFSIAAGFVDIDAGDELHFSQVGLPSGLTLNTDTGAISGTPAVGSAAGSVYTVTITATDNGGEDAEQSFQYTVEPATPAEPHIFGSGFE